MAETKLCSLCANEFPATTEYFWRDNRLASGLVAKCKGCASLRRTQLQANRRTALKRYGMTVESFSELSAAQGGVCAICAGPPRWVPWSNKKNVEPHLSVDHNHTTGNVRGLLCGPCNSGLGLLKESKELILRAISYLRKHSG